MDFFRNWKCFWVDIHHMRSQTNPAKNKSWDQTTRLILHHAVEIAGHPATMKDSKLLKPKIDFS